MEILFPSTKPVSLRPWRNAAARYAEPPGDPPLIKPTIGIAAFSAADEYGIPRTLPEAVTRNVRRFTLCRRAGARRIMHATPS